MNELNIIGICAKTSSPKGSVALVMPKAANAFAAKFMEDYNRRFAKTPRHDFDVQHPLDADDNLNQIFTWREPRKVSIALTVRYDEMLLLFKDNDDSHRAMGKYLDVAVPGRPG